MSATWAAITAAAGAYNAVDTAIRTAADNWWVAAASLLAFAAGRGLHRIEQWHAHRSDDAAWQASTSDQDDWGDDLEEPPIRLATPEERLAECNRIWNAGTANRRNTREDDAA